VGAPLAALTTSLSKLRCLGPGPDLWPCSHGDDRSYGSV